jgi:hypothetical protein
MTEEEQKSLVSYEVQNLILEIAAKGIDGEKSLSLEEISTSIIRKIRSHSLYWEKYSNPWQNIQLLCNPELMHEEEKKEA